MITKELGKIESVKFGLGGYQDCCIGLSLYFKLNGSGISDFVGYWDTHRMGYDEQELKANESDRIAQHSKTMEYLSKLLNDANVDSVDQLKGKPVEVTIESNQLKNWRILTEVI
jgi:hypothetical protein